MITSNEETLNRLKAGDESVFDAVYKQYYKGLCAFASQYVAETETEEIVQEVMLWMWEKREEIIIESCLNQYLFKMTYHRSLNLITKKEIISRAETYFFSRKQEEMLEDIHYYQMEELT